MVAEKSILIICMTLIVIASMLIAYDEVRGQGAPPVINPGAGIGSGWSASTGARSTCERCVAGELNSIRFSKNLNRHGEAITRLEQALSDGWR
jgi:hypothetical protein